MPDGNKSGEAYWAANIKLVTMCMIIWAVCSYGFGIILRPALDAIPVGGVGLGFWFAQQGSIFTFVILIWVYAWRMNKLDDEYFADGDE